jgi:ABC-type antimicrobial peptide transport system permease subunit
MTAPIEMTPAVAVADPDVVLAGTSGKEIQGRSLGQIAWMRLGKDKVAMAGGSLVVLLILIAIIGPQNGFYYIDPEYMLVPGLTIFITVLAFNLFGDGLRDALDPRTR